MITFYPWERNEKPYFVNEEGFEWYIDKINTDYAIRDESLWSGGTRKGLKNVGAFYVKKGGEFKSVLINNEQEVIAEHSNSIGLYNRILMIKVWEDFATHEDRESLKERKEYIKNISDFTCGDIQPIKLHSEPNNKTIY